MKRIFTLIGALSFGVVSMAQSLNISDREIEISDKFEFNRNLAKTTSCVEDLIQYAWLRQTGFEAYFFTPGDLEAQIMPYSGAGYVTGVTAAMVSEPRYNGGAFDGPLQTDVPFEVSVIDILPDGSFGDTLYIETIVQDETDFIQEFTFTDSVPVTRDYMITATQNSAEDYIYYLNANGDAAGDGLSNMYLDGDGDGTKEWYNVGTGFGLDSDALMESRIVNVNTANFNYTGNTNPGENISFDNISSIDTTGYHNNAATIYSWDFGDGNTSTATNPVHTYATCGVFTAELTVTYESSAGDVCEDIYSEDIEINSSDSVIVATANTSACGNADGEIEVSLQNSSEEFTFTVDGTPYASTGSQATATGLTADSYNFTVILDNTGCEFDETASISDGTAPDIALASSGVSCSGRTDAWISVVPQDADTDTVGYTFSWSTGVDADSIEVGEGNYSVTGTNGLCVISANIYVADGDSLDLDIELTSPISCAGASDAELTVTSDGDISGYTFNWNAGAFTGNPITVGPGTYDVVGSGGACATSNPSITVEDTLDPLAVTGAVDADVVTISDISGGTPGYTLSWEGPSGFTAGDEMSITAPENGTYTVTVTDDNGCETQETYTVSEVSLEEFQSHNINVYPNPASTAINFDVEGADAKSIYVYDATGKAIASLDVNTNIVELNVESLSNGLYYYHITKQDGSFLGSSKFTVAK